MGREYVVEIKTVSTDPDVYKAYCYRVEGDMREQVTYTPSGCTRRADVERAAQNMRDDYGAEGSMLKRYYVTRIGVYTEVVSERTDHTTRILMRDQSNKVIKNWLENRGYTRVTTDELATRYPRTHGLCGDYTRTIP